MEEHIPVCLEPFCCASPEQMLIVDDGEVVCVTCNSCMECVDAPSGDQTMSDAWGEAMEEKIEGEEKKEEESFNPKDFNLFSMRFPVEVVVAVHKNEGIPLPEDCREEFIEDLHMTISGMGDIDVETKEVNSLDDIENPEWANGLVFYKGKDDRWEFYFEAEEPTVCEILEANKDREE